jgi:hypothetical protein
MVSGEGSTINCYLNFALKQFFDKELVKTMETAVNAES